MAHSLGVPELEMADCLIGQLTNLDVARVNADGAKAADLAVAWMHAIGPRDATEASRPPRGSPATVPPWDCYRRASLPEQTFEGRDMNLRHAAKLSRTFAAQVEALSRYRGKGQQKVVVEHVHVHSGGQAIVGEVAAGSPTGGGGGPSSKLEDLPHAPTLTHTSTPSMWSPDPTGNAVSVAGSEGADTLPNARRS
jgi:hypothetical protein